MNYFRGTKSSADADGRFGESAQLYQKASCSKDTRSACSKITQNDDKAKLERPPDVKVCFVRLGADQKDGLEGSGQSLQGLSMPWNR
jgi:hypothetical protein